MGKLQNNVYGEVNNPRFTYAAITFDTVIATQEGALGAYISFMKMLAFISKRITLLWLLLKFVVYSQILYNSCSIIIITDGIEKIAY